MSYTRMSNEWVDKSTASALHLEMDLIHGRTRERIRSDQKGGINLLTNYSFRVDVAARILHAKQKQKALQAK
jgi:hypothetical protein